MSVLAGSVPNGVLSARALPIDTHGQLVVYLHRDSAVARAEGLAAHSRV